MEETNLKSIIESKELKVTLSEDEKQIKSTVAMKMARKSKREDYAPTKEELVLINSRITKEDVHSGSGYVFELQVADTDPDRGDEQFTEKSLTKMANLAIKNLIPVLLSSESDKSDHTWKQINVKLVVFNAYVEDGKLIYKAWLPKTKFNEEVIENIFMGLYSKLSVGFSMNLMDYECSACGNPLISKACTHQPSDVVKGQKVIAIIKDVIDNYEVSLVAVPMQPAAHIRRNSLESQLEESLEPKVIKQIKDPETGEFIPVYSIDHKTVQETINTLQEESDDGEECEDCGQMECSCEDKSQKEADLALQNNDDGTIIIGTIQDNSQVEDNTKDLAEQVVADEAVSAPEPEAVPAINVELKFNDQVAASVKSFDEKLALVQLELKTLTDKEDPTVELVALIKSLDEKVTKLAENQENIAKALVAVNDNVKNVDDKVEQVAKAPVVLETKTFKDEHQYSPIENLLFGLVK